jgi:peptidoglycan hydrolase-like protein with peptidoglycan-binding domain
VPTPRPQPQDQPALRVAAVDVRPAKPVPSRRIALYLGIIILVGALAAGGTFALRPAPVPDVGLRNAKMEDLEKALEARRKADPAAAEKWRLEEEAQRKAAEQKAQADAAARQAAIEDARRKVEAEAAVRRKAEDEAWRKALAEAETALRRQVEEDARRKALADAEARRQADEALAKAQAERQRADEEANRKAQAEVSAKADADARKAGELAENGLRLTALDRQRLQVALTSLGFDTRGYDGAFGPRTRDMIAGWQKARSLPSTGFLNASQRQALLREAAAALIKYDDDQKKLEDDRRKADEARRRGAEEARATSSAPADAAMALPPDPPAPPPPPFAAATGSSFDGTYRGNLMVSITSTSSVTASLELRNGRLSGSLLDNRCGTYGFAATVSPSGEIRGTLPFMMDQICSPGQATASGRIVGNRLQLEIRVGSLSASGSLVRSGG